MSPTSLSTQKGALPSLVHPIETTAADQWPKTYRDYLLTRDRTEWDRAFLIYASWDFDHYTGYSTDLQECHTVSWFARNSNTGKVRVISNSCRLRWCPFCARSRYLSIRGELRQWVNKLRRPKFLTLTYRHSKVALDIQVEGLYAAFRKLRQHKFLKRSIRGGVWFFQLKISGKDGEWHPHLHVVLDSDYISQKAISNDWLRTTGNSYIVDIRAIRSPDKLADYVARYAARPCDLSDFSPEQGTDIFSLFHHRRLCGAFGTGRSVKLGHKRVEGFEKWVRIGSWTQVVSMNIRPDCCRKILDAWRGDCFIAEGDCPDFAKIECQQKFLGEISSVDIEAFFDKVNSFW